MRACIQNLILVLSFRSSPFLFLSHEHTYMQKEIHIDPHIQERNRESFLKHFKMLEKLRDKLRFHLSTIAVMETDRRQS